MRFLGIDYGEKRIGIAISDPLCIIAQPLKVLENNLKVFLEIAKICEQYNVKKIVLGLPKTLSGQISHSAKKVESFAKKIREKIPGIDLILYDERLSTVEALKTFSSVDISGTKKKQILDKIAASYILQGFLDGLKKNK